MTTAPHPAAIGTRSVSTSNAQPDGRRLAAAVAAAAGPLLIAGTALLPSTMQGSVDSAFQARQILTGQATLSTSAYLGLWLSLLGIAAAAAASCALLVLVRGRGRRFILGGAALTVLGALGEIVVTSADVLVRRAVAVTGADDSTAQRILQTAFYHGAGIGQFIALSNALGVGAILLGVGIVRSRAIPAWIGWLLPIGVILGTVIAPTGPIGALFAVPLAAAYLAIAFQLARPTAQAAAPGRSPVR